jgi:hypothetical protein
MPAKLKLLITPSNLREPAFFHMIKNWRIYGHGTMLIYVNAKGVQYVQHTGVKGKKTILNDELLSVYLQKDE